MPLYDLLIAVADEPEAHRKKEGDIIAIRPHGWKWGLKEIDQYLVVVIEADEPDVNFMRGLFERPLLEGDHVEGITFRHVFGEDSISAVDMQGNPIFDPIRLGKNKYRISLESLGLGEDELKKVRDKSVIYQPFLKASHVVSKFETMQAKDVDCISVSLGIGAEEEGKITWVQDTDQVMVNKWGQTYLKPKTQTVKSEG